MTGINGNGNVQVGHIEDAEQYRLAQAVSQSPSRPKDVPTWSAWMQAATVEYNKKFGKHVDKALLAAFETRDAAKVADSANKERERLEKRLAKLAEKLNGTAKTAAA